MDFGPFFRTTLTALKSMETPKATTGITLAERPFLSFWADLKKDNRLLKILVNCGLDLLRRGRLCQLMANFILDKAKFAVAYGLPGEKQIIRGCLNFPAGFKKSRFWR